MPAYAPPHYGYAPGRMPKADFGILVLREGCRSPLWGAPLYGERVGGKVRHFLTNSSTFGPA
jgi:hypothetical protein